MKKINVSELKEEMDQGGNPVVIDVRTPVEFRSIHISSAKNIALDSLSEESLSGIISKEDKVHLICQSGARSQKALELLQSLGYTNAISIEGGMSTWSDNKYPVIEGQKAMSIERQVRVAAGGLVVLGVVLSLQVHVYFIGIPAFVGTGLVFAGITDTCGMGMMLARMPWNR